MSGNMKKSRKFSRSLGTHFDRSEDPIYLVSADRKIVYMNPACLAWIGLEPEQAEDLRCFFTSEETVEPRDDSVKGLCPPPELFSTEPNGSQPSCQTLSASIFLSSPEGMDARPATFHRLTEQGELLGVLVFAGSQASNVADDASGCVPGSSERVQSQALHNALATIREHHQSNYSMGNLIGISPFAERLRRQTDAIIGLDAETLITGPPGSGREHLARTIATSSCANDRFPVTVLHCVLADDELTQDSLDQVANQIAHRKNHAKAIPVPSSEQVTPILLLLDIDKLTHTSLIRVEQFLQQSGSACRVISTSEISLLQLAREDKFPAGIAHLLTTIEVPLVPLSHRSEDVPLMAQAFVEQANRTRPRQLSGFDDSSIQLLNEFHWPGNVEQLEQVVMAACDNAAGTTILTDDLPDSFRHAVRAFRIGDPEETKIELNVWLEQLELELIQRAVIQAKGNKTKAAQLLGISRSRLIRRIDHFGLSASSVDKATGGAKPPSAPDDQMIDSSEFEELE